MQWKILTSSWWFIVCDAADNMVICGTGTLKNYFFRSGQKVSYWTGLMTEMPFFWAMGLIFTQ